MGKGGGHLPFRNRRQGKEGQPQPILGEQAARVVGGGLPCFGNHKVERRARICAEGEAIAWFQVTGQTVGQAQGVV